MSIVQKAKRVCKEEWIAHDCGDQGNCSGSIGRGEGKNRIKVSLESAPVPHVVLDMDRIDCRHLAAKEKGDYLLLAGKSGAGKFVVPIEISRGKNKKAEKITSQLESCAQLALSHVVKESNAKFVPIFVGQSREVKFLRKMNINVRGKKEQIHVLKNEERVADILKRV